MYRHTQVGKLTIAILLGAAALMAWILAFTHTPAILAVIVGAFLAVGFLFGSLTTEVNHEHFRFWFGPGVIRRTFPLRQILACRPVTNPWWYGWGIHWTPSGWLYNVSGLRAVELDLADGRRVRVGTDEPDELCRWIRTRRGVG
jgi:hypothetical protein